MCVKYLVGSDGVVSFIWKSLSILFDGVSIDIYWGIMDCVFEIDYFYVWVFGYVLLLVFSMCIVMGVDILEIGW